MAQPLLHGVSVGYYDRVFHRWLPADRTEVSPDESRYAFFGPTAVGPGDMRGYVHVVDVATGRDRTLGSPLDSYRILGFGKDGIYFIYGSHSEMGPTPGAGLWLMDPDSGSIRQLFKDGWVSAVSDGVAWVMASDQDPHPTSDYPFSEAGPPNPPVINLLMRRDLTSGSIETWLHRPGFNLGVSSAYGSQVLVSVEKPGFYGFLLVTGPSSAVSLNFSGDYSRNPWQATAFNGLGFADQHGI